MTLKTGDALTGKVNEEGKIVLNVEGHDSIYVPEKDSLQIKSLSETKVTEIQTQLAEANRLRDEEHQNLLKEQTNRQGLETKIKEYEPLKAQVTQLTTDLTTVRESSKKAEDKLVTYYKSVLIGAKIPEEKLKDKSLSDLEKYTEIVSLIPQNKGRIFDGGPAGNGGSSTSIREAIDKAKAVKS